MDCRRRGDCAAVIAVLAIGAVHPIAGIAVSGHRGADAGVRLWRQRDARQGPGIRLTAVVPVGRLCEFRPRARSSVDRVPATNQGSWVQTRRARQVTLCRQRLGQPSGWSLLVHLRWVSFG